jgi:hypothetical protein
VMDATSPSIVSKKYENLIIHLQKLTRSMTG